MKIVIDTNIFFHDFLLTGTEFRTLLSELPRLGYTLCIPQIVYDETVNKFLEETRKVFDNAKKLGIAAMQFANFPNISASAEDAKETYKDYFTGTLQILKAEIIGYPAVSHQTLVERALVRKKPFRNSDTGGYRDALLWETILELASNDEISFVTNNPKDFSDEDKNGLHQDLLNDIQSRGLRNVYLFPSVKAFNENIIYPGLNILNEIQQQLSADKYDGLSLDTFLDGNMAEYVGSQELDPDDLNMPDIFESPYLSQVEKVDNISEIQVRQLSSGELLIAFSADMECEFSFYIYKPDYFLIDDDSDMFVWDNDWNEWYVAASATRQVHLDLILTYSPENEKVTSASILGVHTPETG